MGKCGCRDFGLSLALWVSGRVVPAVSRMSAGCISNFGPVSGVRRIYKAGVYDSFLGSMFSFSPSCSLFTIYWLVASRRSGDWGLVTCRAREATVGKTEQTEQAEQTEQTEQMWCELWSTEERIHMRPGHFWACELGDAGDLLADPQRRGSPILAGPWSERRHWPPDEGEPGWKEAYRGMPCHRYDPGDCPILLRCYYHRTADDPEGLTFVRWMGQQHSEVLVVNSSELRAVQGYQKNDFVLIPPQPPVPLRQQQMRAKKRKRSDPQSFDPKQRWRLDSECDAATRLVCEGT